MTENGRLVIEAIIVTIALSAVGAASLFAFVQTRRQSPHAIRQMVQLTNELSSRLSSLERERERDHQAMMRIQLRLAELEIGVRVLIAQVKRMGGEPEWTPPTEAAKTVSEVIDDAALYRSVAALFDIDELDDLAYRLGIEPDELDGKRRDTRARSLVSYAKRRDLLPELIDKARQLRPEGRF